MDRLRRRELARLSCIGCRSRGRIILGEGHADFEPAAKPVWLGARARRQRDARLDRAGGREAGRRHRARLVSGEAAPRSISKPRRLPPARSSRRLTSICTTWSCSRSPSRFSSASRSNADFSPRKSRPRRRRRAHSELSLRQDPSRPRRGADRVGAWSCMRGRVFSAASRTNPRRRAMLHSQQNPRHIGRAGHACRDRHARDKPDATRKRATNLGYSAPMRGIRPPPRRTRFIAKI